MNCSKYKLHQYANIHSPYFIYTRKIEQGIQFRLNEFINRDKNIKHVASAVQSARSFIDLVKQNPEQHISEDQVNTIMEMADSIEKWIAEKVEAQNKLSDTDEPAIISSQVLERTSQLKDHLVTLIEKIKEEKRVQEETSEQNDEQQQSQPSAEEKNTFQSEQEKPPLQSENDAQHTHDEL
jgi:hypoxia up-regulated 1